MVLKEISYLCQHNSFVSKDCLIYFRFRVHLFRHVSEIILVSLPLSNNSEESVIQNVYLKVLSKDKRSPPQNVFGTVKNLLDNRFIVNNNQRLVF